MHVLQCIPELIYAFAFSSVSVHLLWQHRTTEIDDQRRSAYLSILDEVAGRLRAGEAVPDTEAARLCRLAETVDHTAYPERTLGGAKSFLEGRKVGWNVKGGKSWNTEN